MRLAIALAVVVLGLAGCTMLPFVVVHNETGVQLTLEDVKYVNRRDKERFLDKQVGPSRRARIFLYDLRRGLIVTAEGCRYDYGTTIRRAYEASKAKKHGGLIVQIEPDLSVHLLGFPTDPVVRGRFRDAELPGFPLIPEKTCG